MSIPVCFGSMDGRGNTAFLLSFFLFHLWMSSTGRPACSYLFSVIAICFRHIMHAVPPRQWIDLEQANSDVDQKGMCLRRRCVITNNSGFTSIHDFNNTTYVLLLPSPIQITSFPNPTSTHISTRRDETIRDNTYSQVVTV